LEHKEDKLIGQSVNGELLNILVGDVEYSQRNNNIHSDSEIFSGKNNSLKNYSNERFFDSIDTVTINSRKMIYDSNERLAKIRENVVYRDDSTILYTEFLDYDMINRSANYFNGGRVVDGETTLTSDRGFYDTEGDMLTFK